MKILISFKEDYICFYNYSNYKDNDLSRTNILDLNDIALSDIFINENYEFAVNFIKTNIRKRHISKVFIESHDIFDIVLKLISSFNEINYIYIYENKTVTIDIFNFLLNHKNIKTLNCYNMGKINFERLNLTRNIKIIMRKNVENNSYLLRINNLNTYSDIYYKEEIIIDKKLNNNDLIDLEKILNLNHNLKKITIKCFNKKNVNNILKTINKTNKKKTKIIILENDNNINSIKENYNKIKKENKKIIKKHNLNLIVKYEDKYIRKNLLFQLNLNILKISLLFIILFGLIYISFSYINNKKEAKETLKIENKIMNILENIDINDSISDEEKINDEIKKETPKKESAYFTNYSKVFSELKKINKDTVGWLTLNNSIINYPVVQSTDNDKYLNYSFDNTKNPNGWVFMDYRNNPTDLDKNTIIYGHSGNYYVMFGSLYKVLDKNWYTNSTNQEITFNTENKNMKWQIFSIYTIDVTNDYLITNFSSDESYMLFLNKIKNRSIYNFNVDLNNNSKIITLSTCYKDSKHRLVIHAKLKS